MKKITLFVLFVFLITSKIFSQEPPVCVDYLLPNDGYFFIYPYPGVTQVNISLSWEEDFEGTPATQYNVYGGDSIDNLELLNSTTDLSYDWTVGFGEYFWKIVPENSYGVSDSCWIRRFKVYRNPPPLGLPNEFCYEATKIELGDEILCDNTSANSPTQNPNCDFDGSVSDIWYYFIAPDTEEVIIEGNSISSGDVYIAVYDECEGNILACDTDGSVTLSNLNVGQEYYIQVWTNESGVTRGMSSEGTFNLSVVDRALSIEDNIIEGFSIYPNPVNDVLRFAAQDNIDEISVYNLLGQEVLRTQPKVLNTQVDMAKLPTGMYVIKVKVGQQLGSYRVVKE
ncbi:T9SS type A sorting domain-containing protein [Urechidicola croceus]|uniref:Uncharacterized protein n=1 Tax=Urechidicola croceus TaxID=1850246 RepID=A0A1D8P3Q6_9FLAO|nr:T9SS type A sorting domain-containing protein [Urechidicola croceus]AOW19194.1 hypothetical protein LPB138_00165 [Urechidicola croceus]